MLVVFKVLQQKHQSMMRVVSSVKIEFVNCYGIVCQRVELRLKSRFASEAPDMCIWTIGEYRGVCFSCQFMSWCEKHAPKLHWVLCCVANSCGELRVELRVKPRFASEAPDMCIWTIGEYRGVLFLLPVYELARVACPNISLGGCCCYCCCCCC